MEEAAEIRGRWDYRRKAQREQHCWLWRQKKGPHATEGGQHRKAGKGQETDASLEPPGRNAVLPAV